MRINPQIANQMYLNSGDEDVSCLPSGTYSNLAAAKYIKDNDANGDGVLSSDEVSISAEAYAKLDADSDGKVTKDEMKESLAGQDDAIYQFYKNGGAKSDVDLTKALLNSNASSTSTNTYSNMAAASLLANSDVDGDGVLSADELSLSADVFSGMDKDDDGKVSSTELKSALSSKNTAIYQYYQKGGSSTIDDYATSLLTTV